MEIRRPSSACRLTGRTDRHSQREIPPSQMAKVRSCAPAAVDARGLHQRGASHSTSLGR